MNDEVLEAVSEQVHRSWMARKQEQGFANHPFEAIDEAEQHRRCRVPVPGGYQDRCWLYPEQHHSAMVPYADLSEEMKELDRSSVRATMAGIEAAGYRLVKATD